MYSFPCTLLECQLGGILGRIFNLRYRKSYGLIFNLSYRKSYGCKFRDIFCRVKKTSRMFSNRPRVQKCFRIQLARFIAE